MVSELTYNKKSYLNADDIRKQYPKYFIGCAKTIRKVIEKHTIDQQDYIFTTYNAKTDKWTINSYDKPSLKAKLYISKVFVENNIANQTDKEKIEMAPDILELDDDQKFKDANGNIIEIEVRGERHHKKCYFKMLDVCKGFNMPNLKQTLLNKDTNYNPEMHYKIFNSIEVNSIDRTTNKKFIYLTYNGILKVLFNSRTGNAEQFQEWATSKLFTIQLGKQEEKIELASNMLNTTTDKIKSVLKCSAQPVSCVYLFQIGKYKNIKKKIKINGQYNDDDLVYKYGMTKDLLERSKQHEKNYGKMDPKEFSLVKYVYLDNEYESKAETYIKKFFMNCNMHVDAEKHNELVVIPKNKLKDVDEQFMNIFSLYSGNIKSLIIHMTKIEHKLEIAELRMAAEIGLRDKEIENLQLRLQLAARN